MFIAQTESELLKKYDAVEDLENPNLMLQEYIPGADETVGEFEREPFAGPVKDNLIAALAILHAAAGLSPLPYGRGVRGLHFHKEDPVTTHKSCPGRHMVKPDPALVKGSGVERHLAGVGTTLHGDVV